MANDDQDSPGYRVGVRGYAYPDLLLQFVVSNDDVFNTNAAFSLQWFVGRTRTDYCPAGDVRDHLRQPVMRNDYVAIQKTTRAGGIALTNADGSELSIVHVDSDAAAGGDGTFENPFNELDQADGAGSDEGDIILAHSTSVFDTGIVLQDNQRLLGEGNNMTFTVNTAEEGIVTIPETSPARGACPPDDRRLRLATLSRWPTTTKLPISISTATALRPALSLRPAGGAGNPNLHDLAISETTSHGIQFTPDTITDTDDIDNDTNVTERFVRGNVTINNVTFTDVGGNGVDIDSANADVGMANVTLQEAIALTNITSTNGTGRGINLRNTHTGGTATLSNYTWNGGTTSLGGLSLTNIDGTFNASTSTLMNGSTAALTSGVEILGDTDGTLTFANTFAITSVDSEAAVRIDGTDAGVDSLGGQITFAGGITNDTNRSVIVRDVTTGANIQFNGAITDTGTGLLVEENTAGQITFGGDVTVTVDTAGETAISLMNNQVATNIDFAQDVIINSTNGANGFLADVGGTISAPGTVNSISVDTGQALVITNSTIAAGGVHFGDVNRTGSGAMNAIQLENNLGGPITIGNTTDTQGQAGTIAAGTANAVRIANSANVSITGLEINNGAGRTGVEVVKSTAAAMTTNLSDLDIDDGATGISVIGTGGSGSALTMTINDTNISDSTTQGLLFDDVDNTGATPIAVNNTVIDGGNIGIGVDGIHIEDSNGSITFDTATIVRNVTGDNIEVARGGGGTITYNGMIINSTAANAGDTAGRSVNINNMTAGTVTFGASSSINDDNLGMVVEDNSGGTFSFNGNNDFNTGAAQAVTIDNNGGATISLSDLDIDTTSGQGLVATGGGTLSVIGLSNTISRTAGGAAGSALHIQGMTIGAVDFESVNATAGENGIRLIDNTGGTVTIGDTGNAAGQGGTIQNTTGQGVLATNSNVVLNGVTVNNAGSAAGDNAVEINHTNATAMNATLNRVTVTNNTSPGATALRSTAQAAPARSTPTFRT